MTNNSLFCNSIMRFEIIFIDFSALKLPAAVEKREDIDGSIKLFDQFNYFNKSQLRWNQLKLKEHFHEDELRD